MRKELWAGVVAGLLGFSGCVAGAEGEDIALPGDIDDHQPAPGADGKTDAWDYRNDPQRLARQGLQYQLEMLPRSGRAEQMPWTSTYWPTYEDSTNHRWLGRDRLSPVELYDRAFNGWTPPEGFMTLRPMTECGGEYDPAYYEQLGPAARWMSEHRGNGPMRNGRDDDGDGQIDECGDDMDGIETWWGLCHAWVPAAILEPEPIRAVDYNGVRFEVSDITALLITAYDRTEALMLGGRCNARTVERDENGRPRASECRDTNPGAMHVILANFLGIHRRAIAMDRTWDYQVWNQPVVGYEVRMMEERTPAEAMRVLGLSGDTYPFNSHAVKLYEVRTDVQWITESGPSIHPTVPTIDRWTRTDRYHYILEVDHRGKIIGGEWAPESRTLHPDFLWVPVRAVSGGNPYVRLDRVRELLRLSRQTEAPARPTTGGNTYANDVPVSIPDNDDRGVASTIYVPAGAGPVAGVTVSVEIEHSYRGDLRVVLEHAGRSVTLHQNEGGNAQNLSLTQVLTQFDGTTAEGAWTLKIADTARADTGRLVRWSITLHAAQTGDGTTGGGTSGGGTSSPRTYRSATADIEIPDNDPTGVSATIDVPESITIRSLQVGVDIQHPYRGDLVVTVEHGGRTVTLHDRAGGSADDLIQQFVVSEFAGMDARGRWTLTVSDRASADVGRLRGFTITVQ
jgi:subtilisin-like proprotein convertase family protein